jgi:hypothetical protein
MSTVDVINKNPESSAQYTENGKEIEAFCHTSPSQMPASCLTK